MLHRWAASSATRPRKHWNYGHSDITPRWRMNCPTTLSRTAIAFTLLRVHYGQSVGSTTIIMQHYCHRPQDIIGHECTSWLFVVMPLTYLSWGTRKSGSNIHLEGCASDMRCLLWKRSRRSFWGKLCLNFILSERLITWLECSVGVLAIFTSKDGSEEGLQAAPAAFHTVPRTFAVAITT